MADRVGQDWAKWGWIYTKCASSESGRLMPVEEGTNLDPIFSCRAQAHALNRLSDLFIVPWHWAGLHCQRPSTCSRQGHLSCKSFLPHLSFSSRQSTVTVPWLPLSRVSSPPPIYWQAKKNTHDVFFLKATVWKGRLHRRTDDFQWWAKVFTITVMPEEVPQPSWIWAH